MKTSVNTFFIVIAFLLGSVETVAKNNPPVPNPNGRTADLDPPPNFPIDENLSFLFIFAVLLGMYIIYNSKLNTKSPI